MYLGDLPVGGLSIPEVSSLLDKQIVSLYAQKIILRFPDHEEVLSLRDLGVTFDKATTLELFVDVSSTSWTNFLPAQVSNLFIYANAEELNSDKRIVILPMFKADMDYMQQKVLDRLGLGERVSVGARLLWTEDAGWHITDSIYGREIVDSKVLVKSIAVGILRGVFHPGDEKIYDVKYRIVRPDVMSSDLQPFLDQIQSLSSFPVTITYDGEEFVLDISNSGEEWLSFDFEKKKVNIHFSRLEQFVEELSKKLDRDAQDILVKSIEDIPSEYMRGTTFKRVVTEGEMRPGRKLDREQLRNDLLKAFTSESEEERTVKVFFDSVESKIRSDIVGLEFPDLLSVGRSDYSRGNHPDRVHNIYLGLKTQDMIMVEPGERFSFNQVLGWVTLDKGYKMAKVIFGTGIGYAPGGGLCQVSTTMYRAAVYAGLPIVKRKPHSWDVSYYRDVYGIDAAVYPPNNVDLIFENDTPGPILIHGYADADNEMAYFEIYGRSDGRKVELTPVTNVKLKDGGRYIKWYWDVLWKDGSTERREINSRYWK